MKKKAFTLVEIILVVTILGILAAVVLPTFQNHATSAKESAAKTNLMTIRSQIELYKLQHNGYTPGYVNKTAGTDTAVIERQLVGISRADGLSSTATVPTVALPYGPYLRKIPKNSFNNLSTISVVPLATAFASVANGTSSGWLYKVETGEFGINWTGTDSQNVAFYNY